MTWVLLSNSNSQANDYRMSSLARARVIVQHCPEDFRWLPKFPKYLE